tara:strand:+ start:3105 stop:3323 length:219 start_codon:yes stop_codon:yes gene_type:complete
MKKGERRQRRHRDDLPSKRERIERFLKEGWSQVQVLTLMQTSSSEVSRVAAQIKTDARADEILWSHDYEITN